MHIIPDAVGIYMVTFLSLHEVENMRCVSKRWIDLANNPFLWQRLVNLMVLDKQISTYTPLLNRLMKEKTSWRQIYWTLDADGARTRITKAEIVRLKWAFSDGERMCVFKDDTQPHTLKMDGFGKLVWNIKAENGAVIINNFPEHIVERLPNWGWCLKNHHIYILSIEPTNTSKSLSTKEDINKAFEIARTNGGENVGSLQYTVDTGDGSSANTLTHLLHLLMTRFQNGVEEEEDDESEEDDEVNQVD